MVVVKYNTIIKATTITLGVTVTLTATNVCQMKTIPHLYDLQSIQLQTMVKVELNELTSCHLP